MVGMLQAIPKTPLYNRLKLDGRLVEEDPVASSFPKQNRPGPSCTGYWDLVKRLYSPEAYLERYFKVYKSPSISRSAGRSAGTGGRRKELAHAAYGLLLTWALFKALLRDGSLFSVGRVYASYFFKRNLRHRRDIVGFAQFMNRCVTHWHFYKFTRELTKGRVRAYNTL